LGEEASARVGESGRRGGLTTEEGEEAARLEAVEARSGGWSEGTTAAMRASSCATEAAVLTSPSVMAACSLA